MGVQLGDLFGSPSTEVAEPGDVPRLRQRETGVYGREEDVGNNAMGGGRGPMPLMSSERQLTVAHPRDAPPSLAFVVGVAPSVPAHERPPSEPERWCTTWSLLLFIG